MRNILYPTGKASYIYKNQLDAEEDNALDQENAALNAQRLEVRNYDTLHHPSLA